MYIVQGTLDIFTFPREYYPCVPSSIIPIAISLKNEAGNGFAESMQYKDASIQRMTTSFKIQHMTI